MKKNIVIGLLTVVSVISTLYSMYWRTEALRQRDLTIGQKQLVLTNSATNQMELAEGHISNCKEQIKILEADLQKCRVEVDVQKQVAVRNAELASRQMELAEEHMKKCEEQIRILQADLQKSK